MSHNWGYREAARHAKEIGLSGKTPSRVTVKAHTRAPKAPPPAAAPSKDIPQARSKPPEPVKMAKGGKVAPVADSKTKPKKGSC